MGFESRFQGSGLHGFLGVAVWGVEGLHRFRGFRRAKRLGVRG